MRMGANRSTTGCAAVLVHERNVAEDGDWGFVLITLESGINRTIETDVFNCPSN